MFGDATRCIALTEIEGNSRMTLQNKILSELIGGLDQSTF